MTQFSEQPSRVKVNVIYPNTAQVWLRDEINKINDGQWEAEEYELRIPYSVTLEKRIESNFDAWLEKAKFGIQMEAFDKEERKRKQTDRLRADIDYLCMLSEVNLDE